jgi:membrane-bound serine protease (ClpP class)
MSFVILVLMVLLSLNGAYAQQPNTQNKVLVLKVHKDVEAGLSFFIQRQLRRAEKENIAAIILEINSNGGVVTSSQEIKDALLHSKVKTAAYIKGRALSAAALIAISCTKIYMEPDAKFGAATPIMLAGDGVKAAEEKFVSSFAAEFRSSAEFRHRNPYIAEAMVDKNHETIEGLSQRGTILTLTAEPATNFGYCDGIVSSLENALRLMGLTNAEIEHVEPSSAEQVARFLTNPQVSPILFTLGFWALLIEFLVPGFGLPGITGILLLGAFFGGHLFAYLAGFEIIILFVVGIILLALEIFVIPGFGIVGISGIAALLTSLVITFGGFYSAINYVLTIIAYSFFVGLAFYWMAPKIKIFDKFILKKEPLPADGYVAIEPDAYSHLLGLEGVTTSICRPSGIAKIGDERVNVVSEGDFIESGTPIIVRKVENNKVVVRKIEE